MKLINSSEGDCKEDKRNILLNKFSNKFTIKLDKFHIFIKSNSRLQKQPFTGVSPIICYESFGTKLQANICDRALRKKDCRMKLLTPLII